MSFVFFRKTIYQYIVFKSKDLKVRNTEKKFEFNGTPSFNLIIQFVWSIIKRWFMPFDVLLGPLCYMYKLITIVNCYLKTGLTCIVY